MKRLILLLLVSLVFLLLFPGCDNAEIPQAPITAVENLEETTSEVIEPETPEKPAEEPEVEAPVVAEEVVPESEEPQQVEEAAAPAPAEKSAPAAAQPKSQQSTPKAVTLTETQKPKEPEPASAQPAAPEAKPVQPVEEHTPSASEELPKPEPHTHSYTATVVEPTCTDWGYTTHVCACGDRYKDSCTKPLGHDYQLTGHADATTAAAGYDEYTCSRCGVSYRETIPQLVQTGATSADAQRVCDEVNSYIGSHYAMTQNRGTYTGVTWVQTPSDVQGAISSAIGTVDLYAQYYGAKSFYCSYYESGGSYTIVLYWDTV